MWLLYLILFCTLIGFHYMLYILIKVGIKESEKPLPPHIRRRRPLELHTVLQSHFHHPDQFSIWPY